MSAGRHRHASRGRRILVLLLAFLVVGAFAGARLQSARAYAISDSGLKISLTGPGSGKLLVTSTWRVTIENLGGTTAHNLVVTYVLPNGFVAAGPLEYTVAALAPRATVVFDVSGTPRSCDSAVSGLRSSAQVRSDEDPRGATTSINWRTTATPAFDGCDGVDDDCDGRTDEDFRTSAIVCTLTTGCDGDACFSSGSTVCNGAAGVGDDCAEGATSDIPLDLTCDGVDDDADGRTDEDYLALADAPCAPCQKAAPTRCIAGQVLASACVVAANRQACDAGACALAGECLGGQCEVTRIATCNDDDPCTVDTCDPLDGCANVPGADGAGCDDGDDCTAGDTCSAGVCAGQATTCAPPGVCESGGTCNPATGLCGYELDAACAACVVDDTPPTIVCPNPVTINTCARDGVVVALGSPTVSDDCSSPTVSDDAPALYHVGFTPVRFRALDASGNDADCLTGVTVADEVPPVISCPTRVELPGDPETCGAVPHVEVSAFDTCDGEDVPVYGPETDVFMRAGTKVVEHVAIDRAGNQAFCQTEISVTGLDDFTIECEPEVVVDAPDDFCGHPQYLTALAVDQCHAEYVLTTEADSFPVGTTLIDFDAERDDGVSATCRTNLLVRDVTPPTVDCGAPDLLVVPPALFLPSADDVCGVDLEIEDVQCVRVIGDERTPVVERCEAAADQDAIVHVDDAPPLSGGEMLVTYTLRATDPSGNVTTLDCEASVDADALDHDGDTIVDRDDNCVFNPNTDQVDSDLDEIGDVCDPSPFDGFQARGDGATGCRGGGGGGVVLGLLLALVLIRPRRV